MTVLAELGEKRLIEELIAPLFNPRGDRDGVGDDCAVIDVPDGYRLAVSTDRVPADLIAYRLGILDHRGLGSYLARLNLSDIAAVGGSPHALLLNAGLSSEMAIADLTAICEGFAGAARRWGCEVVGGDLSASPTLSLSATALGIVPKDGVLRRDGARPGETVVACRPPGLTPAAFAALCDGPDVELTRAERSLLEGQFALEPMFDLIDPLRKHGVSGCMDNTDGLGQSLAELASASGCAFVVSADLDLPAVVRKVALAKGVDPLALALSPGADFGLVATLPSGFEDLPPWLHPLGTVEAGEGVWLDAAGRRTRLEPSGWDHFLVPAA